MNLSEAEELFDLADRYTQADVKASYTRLALRYHPDRNDASPASHHFMCQINEAYDLLKEATSDWPARSRQAAQKHSRREAQARQEQERKKAQDEERRRAAEAEERRKAEERKRQAEEKERKRKEELERKYQRACELALEAKTSKAHEAAAEAFLKLGDYKDSRLLYENHFNLARGLREEERDEFIRKYKTPTAVLNALSGLSVISIAAAFVGVTLADDAGPDLFLLIVEALLAICGVLCMFRKTAQTVSIYLLLSLGGFGLLVGAGFLAAAFQFLLMTLGLLTDSTSPDWPGLFCGVGRIFLVCLFCLASFSSCYISFEESPDNPDEIKKQLCVKVILIIVAFIGPLLVFPLMLSK